MGSPQMNFIDAEVEKVGTDIKLHVGQARTYITVPAEQAKKLEMCIRDRRNTRSNCFSL